MIAVVALVTIAIVGSARVKVQTTETHVKCHAAGDRIGMSITWGVPKSKCMAQCGPTNKHGFTYEYEFTRAFSVTFGTKCECSAGGRKVVQFKPVNKAQALECSNGDSMEIRDECWRTYIKARGTRFVPAGSLRVPSFTVPFAPSDFVVTRMCRDTCEEGACDEVLMPGALDGMDRPDKAALGQAVKQIMDGNGKDVSDPLKDLINILPEGDLDDAEFVAIDADGDGMLSADELGGFYTNFTPDQIKKFVDAVDENENGQIDPEEFSAFKDEMRNFNPAVDLVTGVSVDYMSGLDDVFHEVKAEWKAVAVKCMKDGVEVAAEECEGSADDAIKHFDLNCVGQ